MVYMFYNHPGLFCIETRIMNNCVLINCIRHKKCKIMHAEICEAEKKRIDYRQYKLTKGIVYDRFADGSRSTW